VINLTLGFCIVLGCVFSIGLRPSLAWADNEEEDEVEELMEKTHEGKNSPWKKSQRAVSKDPIDWATLNTALPRLNAMSKSLATTKNKEVRESADGYVDAVTELIAKTKKEDAAGVRAAIMSLSKSCTDCHYKGGPGGKLED
jgi:hypothetical protein